MATQNSSTFSSDPKWKRFLNWFFLLTLFSLLILYASFHIIDPYDIFPFSPDFPRVPVSHDQWYFHPIIAKKKEFDSAIFGTSTSRLLCPERLNPIFQASFASLGFNNGSAYEQQKLFNMFMRNHQNVKVVIFGIDIAWCRTSEEYKKFNTETGTSDLFPEWLYDENPWNNCLPLSAMTFENTKRQLLAVTNLEKYRFGLDGYSEFTPPQDEYDIIKVRKNIYKSEKFIQFTSQKKRAAASPPKTLSSKECIELKYPALSMLEDCLRKIPADSLKILFFVPYHIYRQPSSGSLDAVTLQVCKQRIVKLAKEYPNTYILDFMIESDITTKDENYWDPLHFTVETAILIEKLIYEGVKERKSVRNYFHYLGGSEENQKKDKNSLLGI
jgi:hypothetical protein